MKSATSEANTADEVEVTPEMIEAGISALYDVPSWPESGQEDQRLAITLCFRAMLRAHLEQRAVK